MKRVIYSVLSLFVCTSVLAHESNQSYFKIIQSNTTVEILADFPWTIRTALLDFESGLKTSESQDEFNIAFFNYIKSTLILTDIENNELELLKIEELNNNGHSHQNSFKITFKGTSLKKISNSIMFNINKDQINRHLIYNADTSISFITNNKSVSHTIEKISNSNFNYLWLITTLILPLMIFKKRFTNQNTINPIYLLIPFILFVFACNSDDDIESAQMTTEGTEEIELEVEPNTNAKPNILLIIADDMGLDATQGYNIGSIQPNMPTLTNLMNTGIKFNNVWSNPTCSPTRGTILTGKYGFRTGVTKVDDEMPTSETSIQSYLKLNGASEYSNAVIGKWHLSKNESHPNSMGIDYYAGVIGGGVQSYTNWKLTVNGQTTNSSEYTTTKFTDLAIDWIDSQKQPWFLWLAYNAPHSPFHLPPINLHSQDGLPSDDASIAANPLPYYLAMIEAMDTEMGRLIESMSQAERDNTVIIFIGDNGTPGQVVQTHSRFRAKGSVYQGGVNIPMVISGKNVTRVNEMDNDLINTTDLFATVANIAGINASKINDSKSFYELLSVENLGDREYAFAQAVKDTDSDYTVRNKTHKYILFEDKSEALFDIKANEFENPNLLNGVLSDSESSVKLELTKKLKEILD